MRLVGFIIRIFHDARSPERQICCQNRREYDIYIVFKYMLDICVKYNVTLEEHTCISV